MSQKKRRKRSAAENLADQMKLDAQLKALIYSGIAEAKQNGAFVIVKVPWKLIRELSVFEQRRGEERECN
jgi:hypothetical protein